MRRSACRGYGQPQSAMNYHSTHSEHVTKVAGNPCHAAGGHNNHALQQQAHRHHGYNSNNHGGASHRRYETYEETSYEEEQEVVGGGGCAQPKCGYRCSWASEQPARQQALGHPVDAGPYR
ncbi:hypothetical protein GQ55_5G047200 [Panicum hallii var. hallii]|uniref:Uncharacterized protein n=1 Tax=Panicum hallii var. hallii TaxID=1504633 RepID=A0A2T7DCR7_9POAL|nr:hypothetical protein GQ55_5G047200 [Panicum hallii var. hallii]